VVGVDPGDVGLAIETARDLGVVPRSVAASGSRVSLVVEEGSLDGLVRALHARLVG
jgi:hypothetical protein